MKQGPLAVYRRRLASGALKGDPAQGYAVEQLQLLANRLKDWQAAQHRRVLSLIFGHHAPLPRGLYLFGDVGRGKTMLMDLFFEQVDFERKKRVHFHPFMREVHALIKEFRALDMGDPIPLVAKRMLAETRLLCLDELHVNDITDAMILGRLFTAMFQRELILVATSNAPPRGLYKDGLNRALFIPFIELVEGKMDVLQLEADRDYRYDGFRRAAHYFVPADETSRFAMDALWQQWAGRVEPHDGAITVDGRKVTIPAMGGGMARFQFADLCGKPLGTHDYLALCEHFHTFFIEGVPVLSGERCDEARRFINLVDTLYDNRRLLIVSAMAEPEALFAAGRGADEFARTASRLAEMRRSDWPPQPALDGI